MENQFQLLVDAHGLSAWIQPTDIDELDGTFQPEMIHKLLADEKVIFGVSEEVIQGICRDPFSVEYPIRIAKGIPGENGSDAYLLNEVSFDRKTGRKGFNFRDVLHIPSVTQGQLLASVIPATPGASGKNIFGKLIPAKDGKPLRVKAGKNVFVNGDKYYSLLDGQVSFTQNSISVNPVFEVKGDLDLKTGNINFVGNVVIRGNVPAGYEIKAGGDIIVAGLVEGSFLQADNNVLVTGGISGSHKGSVVSGGSVQAAYLNQANVKAEQDVIIQKSILHSDVQAGGAIRCSGALVIGGKLQSGSDIEIKELGNHLFTKTELLAGMDSNVDNTQKELLNETAKLHESIKKLDSIEGRLTEMAKLTGKLTDEQRIIILKQRATKAHLQKKMSKINEDLAELEREKEEKMNASILIYGQIYPNTAIHFGKYSKVIRQTVKSLKFHFLKGEIRSEPLSGM
ncbi:FapA family protein [Cytobacillus firmus]|uniref:FapA family protein n=1 Tax=Cytobacillus firmus TaxID=1399 RepID=UPI0030027A95